MTTSLDPILVTLTAAVTLIKLALSACSAESVICSVVGRIMANENWQTEFEFTVKAALYYEIRIYLRYSVYTTANV